MARGRGTQNPILPLALASGTEESAVQDTRGGWGSRSPCIPPMATALFLAATVILLQGNSPCLLPPWALLGHVAEAWPAKGHHFPGGRICSERSK